MLTAAELSDLWRRHAAALLMVARGHCGQQSSAVAEDCVQEAFVRLASQRDTPDCPAAWLMTCVRHRAIDAVRSASRRTKREQFVARKSPAWFAPQDTDQLDRELLQQVLEQLDQETRDIIIGHLWNDLTFDQLADVVGVSKATAHRRYEAGLRQMKQMLKSDQVTLIRAQP